MNSHPYLRAYMAGIVLPTLFLLVAMTAFVIARFVLNVPIPIERAIVFPMAVVPNVWGLWNMLYLALRSKRRLPIGMHGAILPLILLPAGMLLALALQIPFAIPALALGALPFALVVYYLLWNVVGYFNSVLEIA